MFILANFITALADIIHMFLTLYLWIIVARAAVSWLNPDPYNPIVLFLYRVTEPVLAPIRRWIPLRGMGIDVSPIIVIAAIMFLQRFLLKSLIELPMYLK